MAKIFKTKELENEFNQFIYKIIPSLNECGNCGILNAVTVLNFQSIVVDVDCGNVKIVKCLKLQKIFCLKNAATNNGNILLILFMIFLNCLIILLIFLVICN